MSPHPQDDTKRQLSWRDAWRYTRELFHAHRRRLSLGFFLLLINRAAGLVLPASTKFVVDDVLGKQHLHLLTPVVGAVGLAMVVQAVTSFSLSQVIGVAAQRAITDMRRRLQEHVLHLPVRFFDKTQSGNLVARIMTDPEGIRNLVGTGLVQLLGGLLTALIAVGVLFYLNWLLTVTTLLIFVVFGAYMAFTFRYVRPIFRERSRINAELTARLTESLGGIRVVKAYCAEKRERLTFAEGAHRLFRNIRASMTAVSLTTAVATVVLGAIAVTMMLLGTRAITENYMTVGDLAMYIFFSSLLAAPIVQIAAIGTQLSEAYAGLDRIHDLMSLTREDSDDAHKVPVGQLEGNVVFEDVWFSYTPGQPVLRGITFEAPAGTTTALVGPSGAGKSTLIGLVLAFHFPERGVVRVDGYDLTKVRLRDYRRHLGVVLQDNFLFDGTILDNVRFSNPRAGLEEVWAALRIAHCDEFIREFPDGIHTIIGERGVRLSGGQRQRLAIARALLADPTLLVLDEATSNLDSEREALIQDALRTLRRGRTTFVIAHRLSTIRSADQILVLDNGEIVERGTHAELLALGGRYKALYDKQYAAELERFINPGEEILVNGA